MRFMSALCFLGFTACPVVNAEARVNIAIDLGSQTMHVSSASGDYVWPVSTARSGYVTPRGHYHATGLQRMHYSRKYDMSPMPNSIFFKGGYAIHGTHATGHLGHPASHGCVRLSPGNAARLYEMVKAEGADIEISGSPPRTTMYARHRNRDGAAAFAARRHRDYGNEDWRAERALAYAPGSRGHIAARAGRIIQPVYRGPFSWEAWP
ncbi:L,D-transpeptidase [Methylocapsa palsarum]|uniref:L,D-transpeptidase catalytic domain n=1 Tax=Methylocapsa palsarum TaxID=1612308 RepID=A0A1I3YMW4_9HYPH|nr:L,D-transpeptidase [Methylocapsa palsarum]SFK33277.1 L,D-transpeptidase catalytic domain [Methylocapsa palsarum]